MVKHEIYLSSRLVRGVSGGTFSVNSTQENPSLAAGSERLFRAIFDSQVQHLGLLSPGGVLLEANRTALEAGGVTAEEVIGTPVWETRWWTASPETQARLRSAVARAADGETVRYEVEVRGAGAELILLDFSVKPMRDEGGRVTLLITEGRDITARRRAEEALREREQVLRTLGDSLPNGVIYQVIHRPDGPTTFPYMSAGVERLFGVTAREVMADASVLYDLIHRDDLARLRAVEAEALRSHSVCDCEVRQWTRGGELRWIHSRSAPRRLPDGSTLWDGVGIDITARKLAEEALRQSEQHFQAFMDHLPLGAWVVGEDGRCEYVNRCYSGWSGLSPRDLLGKTSFDLNPPEIARSHRANDRAVLDAGQPLEFLERMSRPDGTRTDLLVVKFPMRDPSGGRRVGGVALDITERRRAEEQLRVSEERYRFLAESIPPLVWVYDGEGRPIQFNRRWFDYTGQTPAQTFTDRWFEVLHPDDVSASLANWERSKALGVPLETEHRFRRASDGEHRWHLSRAEPMRDEAGRVVRWFGTSTDIHDLRMAREELRQTLRQREVLLKEVHHRVKNNLQVVSSLLRLQSRCVADERVTAALRESQDRVLSMALVHENLYQSGDLGQINLTDYVRSLVSSLARSNSCGTSRVEFRTEVEPRFLDLDRAVPCGLLLNELLTNCLKHAFPGDRPGTVFVRLWGSEGALHLSVQDDGVGLPGGKYLPSGASSLGLQLVHDLAEQLQGVVRLSCDAGTRAEVRFPLPAEAPLAGGSHV
jgi:PAS domain S-box-containing protein